MTSRIILTIGVGILGTLCLWLAGMAVAVMDPGEEERDGYDERRVW